MKRTKVRSPMKPIKRKNASLARSGQRCYALAMSIERVRHKLRNGFRPFALELSSGKRYVVSHPEFIMVGKNVVVVMGKDDSVTTIDALHITAIEDWPLRKNKSVR
jgi:hypothetical protein